MNRPILSLTLLALVFSLSLTATSQAAEKPGETYSFDVPKKLVVITFESRMEIEDILGTTRTVSGQVTLDGSGGGSFAVEIPTNSLRTGIDMRDGHLRSEKWLDAKRFPSIRLEGSHLKRLSDKRYEVTGTFTMHGVSRPLTVPVDVLRIPADRAKKLGLGDGDWLRVRAEFPVKISDFGVKIPAMAAAKVNDEWTVKVSLFGRSSATTGTTEAPAGSTSERGTR